MLAGGLLVPGVGVAQTPINVRGVIVESDKRSVGHPPMIVGLDDGSRVSVELAINAEAIRVVASALRAIAPPRQARAIVERKGDGTLHARAVILLPAGAEDGRDGQEAWDRPPGSLRLQGTVAAAVPGGDAVAIALRDGVTQWTIVADASTRVVELAWVYDKGYAGGDAVFIAATRQRDGRVTAGRVFFGKDGLVPPM
jgi:hypothetical protein